MSRSSASSVKVGVAVLLDDASQVAGAGPGGERGEVVLDDGSIDALVQRLEAAAERGDVLAEVLNLQHVGVTVMRTD